jgi:CheY-like chemotaxis protein
MAAASCRLGAPLDSIRSGLYDRTDDVRTDHARTTIMMNVDAVLERTAPTTGPAPATPYRLLVVDDQREILDAVRMLFAGSEFTIVPASSPAAALAQARSAMFDAALIDLNYEQGRTSGEQGLELVTALRAAAPSLPVIVMTAWVDRRRDVGDPPWGSRHRREAVGR